MTKNKNTLREFIARVFANEQESVLQALKKYELNKHILPVLEMLNDEKRIQAIMKGSKVDSLSLSFLTGINTEIEKIKSPEEKEKAEYIVGDIGKEMLTMLIKRSNIPEGELLDQVAKGLESACSIRGWNFKRLKELLKFDLLHSFHAKTSKPILIKDPEKIISFYRWNGKPSELSELARDLKSRNIIESTPGFKRFFKEHTGDLKVKINPVHRDYMIILFDELHEKKLIKVQGSKAQKFTPLINYSVDLENRKLIKNEGKQAKYTITKNKLKYAELKEKVSKRIGHFKVV